ncbi:MAG: DUF302 domain-containing protein [Sphingobacteriaceae bacterium]|nr:DUF302 domain-containing protein [Sphingobacteriaceae bacterium]
MKKAGVFVVLLLMTSGWSLKAQNAVQFFNSELDYFGTIEVLKQEMDQLGLTVFAEFNHYENALNVGLDVRPVHVIVFGNPLVGSKLIQLNPEVAFELPLKLLVYEGEQGVKVGYLPPSVIKARYEIKGNDELFSGMHLMYNRLAGAVMPSGAR